MMIIPVFRKGSWIHYTVPSACPWSKEQKLKAASAYATAIEKGYSEDMAQTLAEILINKELYPEIQFHEFLEKKCLSLWISRE